MPSLLTETGWMTGGPSFIDPNYSAGFIDQLKNTNPNQQEPKEKGSFWNSIGGFLGNVGSTLFSGKNDTGSLIDLSKIVKLPSVNVDPGAKAQQTFKWVAIGAAVLALIFILRPSGRRR